MEISYYIERAANIQEDAKTDVFSASIKAGQLLQEVWAANPNGYQIGELRTAIHAFQDAIDTLHKQLQRCE